MATNDRSLLKGPRQFFDEFVVPTVEDWRADPLCVRKAIVAISQLDIMADQVILFEHPSLHAGQLRRVSAPRRAEVEADFPLRLLLRDVHDTHKHGPLNRRSALIRTGRRPEKARLGGYVEAGYVEAGYQAQVQVLQIVTDDNNVVWVETVIEEGVNYWRRELASLGL